MNLQKSIDFLLENAGCVIQYRLRKEILGNITEKEEEDLLRQIYQTPYFKMVESYAKPSGFIGNWAHGYSNWRGKKLHETPLQDGESAARLLCNYAVPRELPLVKNFVTAMRDETAMLEEVSLVPVYTKYWNTRFNGIHQGGGSMTLFYTMQAILGYGDDDYVKPFLEISLSAFASVLSLGSLDEIIIYNPHLKKKYNWPYIEPETEFPCMYHLETLAYTQNWRTPRNIQLLANALNHMDNIMLGEQFTLKSGLGGFYYYSHPIYPFTNHGIGDPNIPGMGGGTTPRKTLTHAAMCGLGNKADCLRISIENLEKSLRESPDGALRMKDVNGKIIKSKPTPYAYAYDEAGYENNLRKKSAFDCEMTFWAIQFLHYADSERFICLAQTGEQDK